MDASIGSVQSYKLYYLLSKIYYYRQANHVQAKMVLLIPEFPESCWQGYIFRDKTLMISSLQGVFAPAIKNNLLEIMPVRVSEEELDGIRKKIEREKTGGA